MGLGHVARLIDRELELLETFLALVKQGERDSDRIYRLAAARLKISPVTVRTRLSRLRTKYERLVEAARDYRGWQQTFFQRTGGSFNPLSRRGSKREQVRLRKKR